MVCRYGIYHAGWLPGEKSSSCAAIVVKRELWRVFKCVGPKWPQNAILDHIPPVSLSSLLRNPIPEARFHRSQFLHRYRAGYQVSVPGKIIFFLN
jgi:hypothetical protein